MKILRNILALGMSLLLLVGCRPTGHRTADYRETPFRAEIRFEAGGVAVYAEVETALADGVLHSERVRLLAPPSLAGITLEREGETIVLVRDGMRIPCPGAAHWWEMASLLCAEGTLHYVCEAELEGLSLDYAEILDGERVYEIYRERETGIPKRIATGEHEVTVIRFERIEARA